MHLEDVAHDDRTGSSRDAYSVQVAIRRASRARPDNLVGDLSYKYDKEARRDARACDVAQLRECVNKRDDYRMPRWQTKEEVADPSIEYDEAGIGLSHQEAIWRNMG